MSKLFGSLASKLIGLLVIVLFVIGFKESILTDEGVSAAFKGLMEIMPFSKLIVDVICKYCGYAYKLDFTGNSIGTEIMTLLVMAFLQPLFVRLASVLFLRMPSSMGIDASETFMSRPSYRIKEVLISIIITPFVAVISLFFSRWLFNYFSSNFNSIIATILQLLSTLFVGGISIVALLGVTTLGTAIAWRGLITIGASVVNTLVTETICLWMYVSMLQGVDNTFLTGFFAIAFWFIIFDVFIQWLQRSIAAGIH